MKTFEQYVALLKEGGNLFEGTRRILKSEVIPTIKYLEKITGLSLIDTMLGSTGKAESSGDLDLGVDATKITKEDLISILNSQGYSQDSIKKTGIEVGFKAPIYKDNTTRLLDEFVQVDFMFHVNIEYLKWFYSNNEKLPLKGKDRNIMLSAVAKNKGLTLSINGLSNRENKQFITYNPDQIAKAILDNKASKKDLHDVASIGSYLVKLYGCEQAKAIVAQAEATTGIVLINC